jgi:hypothetical protein
VHVVVWSAEGNAPDLTATFAAVVDVIRDWRAAGRMTTTAGVKSAIQQKTPGGFDEKNLGFPDFRSFVQAGQQAGHFRLQRLPTGHWAMLLPGETLEDALEARQASEAEEALRAQEDRRPSGATPPALVAEDQRFRPDVWSAFVDWRASHQRLWDRQVGRAFAYPVDEEGRPSWETESLRFAEINPADESIQIGWMREWAATLSSPDREIITRALSDDAPRGEFRRQLSSLGRLVDWRAELQRRVAQHVGDWASEHDVNLNKLIEHRTRHRVQERVVAPPKPLIRSEPTTRTDIARTDTARLRAKLHRIIDSMPLSELVALQIPAQYLLLDDE